MRQGSCPLSAQEIASPDTEPRDGGSNSLNLEVEPTLGAGEEEGDGRVLVLLVARASEIVGFAMNLSYYIGYVFELAEGQLLHQFLNVRLFI